MSVQLDQFFASFVASPKWQFFGMISSFVGLIIAIWQLHQVRTVAEETREIARETKQQVSQKLFLVDIANAIQLIRQSRIFISQSNFQVGSIRLRDLCSALSGFSPFEDFYQKIQPKHLKAIQQHADTVDTFPQMNDVGRRNRIVNIYKTLANLESILIEEQSRQTIPYEK